MSAGEDGTGDAPAAPRPQIRQQPEDFLVEEELLYPLSDDGAYTYMLVEKRLRNTDDVARELARRLRVPTERVGYAGRKDRRAVARQWFSVPGTSASASPPITLEGAEVLEARRHRDRLQLGELAGNRFRVQVRRASPEVLEAARRRLAVLAEQGLPNRFGGQRFGRHGDNAELGARLLAGERLAVDRRRRRLYLSALQSAVFNRVLACRPTPLGRLMDGDLAFVHRGGGLHAVNDAAGEQPRADRFEVSPTGPLFGTRARRPVGAPLALEQQVLLEFGLPLGELRQLPSGISLPGDRRPLRVPLAEAALEPLADGFSLRVFLPPGSYVTVLLEELLPDGFDEVTEDGGSPPRS